MSLLSYPVNILSNLVQLLCSKAITLNFRKLCFENENYCFIIIDLKYYIDALALLTTYPPTVNVQVHGNTVCMCQN